MKEITITYKNEKYNFNSGSTLLEISKKFQEDFSSKIIIGEINGRICELNKSIENNCTVNFYDNTSSIGNLVYENGLVFILIKAFDDALASDVVIRYSIDKGVYFNTKNSITKSDLDKVSNKMREIIENNMKIDKKLVDRLDAINYYKKRGVDDKVDILKYTTNTNINLYKLGSTYDYFFSYLPIKTGYITNFKLTYIDENSFVLNYPNMYLKRKKLTYNHHEKLFDEFKSYSNWIRNLQINSVSDINKIISNGKLEDLILMSENYQNNKLYDIAKTISKNKKIKIILMSGPSSSGKTTSSKKLNLFLKSFGLRPVSISIDDYFLDRECTPKKNDGSYDFESINAIDIELFNDNLTKLLNGEEVSIPTYNFIMGKKEYNKNIKLKENEVLIIEGLHALNEILTSSIPRTRKYKIYLSPLTVLNIDDHNRIKTTDNRLLRRIVRDNRSRGYDADHTLSIWKSVREGEEENVFPFQDEADVVFNTSLLYEMNVLKTYVEPLLYSVDESSDNYKEAIRLLNILKNVLPMPGENVPSDSIIREFIGNSYFNEEG